MCNPSLNILLRISILLNYAHHTSRYYVFALDRDIMQTSRYYSSLISIQYQQADASSILFHFVIFCASDIHLFPVGYRMSSYHLIRGSNTLFFLLQGCQLCCSTYSLCCLHSGYIFILLLTL